MGRDRSGDQRVGGRHLPKQRHRCQIRHCSALRLCRDSPIQSPSTAHDGWVGYPGHVRRSHPCHSAFGGSPAAAFLASHTPGWGRPQPAWNRLQTLCSASAASGSPGPPPTPRTWQPLIGHQPAAANVRARALHLVCIERCWQGEVSHPPLPLRGSHAAVTEARPGWSPLQAVMQGP